MPARSAVVGVEESVKFARVTLVALGSMVGELVLKGKVPMDVSGPIGIASEVHKEQVFEQGWLVILNFAALLSVNLAIMNVLPIPALDGGRAFFILLEILIGRRRRAWIESRANSLGFAFLILLIVLISFKDVWQLIFRK
jgi:regulator of sigma E protease